MAVLQDILYKVSIRSIEGQTAHEINDLQIDSRKVQPGSVFIAIKGSSSDGHAFIRTAISKGASAIVCETLPEAREEEVTYVQVENSASAAGFFVMTFNGAVGVFCPKGSVISSSSWKLPFLKKNFTILSSSE